jgi:hypothetical protein
MINKILKFLLGTEGKYWMPVVDGSMMNSQGYPPATNIQPVSQASVASLANVVNFFATPLSAANAVTGFRLPRGYRGLFCIIPAAGMSGATGGTLAYATQADGQLTEDIPIAVGFVCAANKAALFVTDGAKVYPVVLTAAG